MSVRVMSMVWSNFPRGGAQLLAMLALADFANDAGESVHPSMRTLAKKLRVSRRQAQKLLRELEAAGFIAAAGSAAGGKQSATRRFRIRIDRLTGEHIDTGEQNDTGEVLDAHGCRKRHGTGEQNDTQSTKETSLTVSRRTSAGNGLPLPPPCPHEKIIDLYHEILPACPRVRIWTADRRKCLQARWREDTERQDLEWWRGLFTYVAKSEFLTGRAQATNGRRTFIANLEWIVRPKNIVKIIEGNYE